jgi:hypothetical protein
LFLGGFAKLRKATIRFVMSVRLSVCMEQLGPYWKDFSEIWYLRVFWKSVEKLQVSLKSDKNSEFFTWRPMYIFDHISLSSSYNEKIFTKRCRENQNTHFIFSKHFSNLRRLWDKVEKYCRAGQATDENMVQAHCMLGTEGYKHTLEYVIPFYFPQQQWLHEHASMLRYTYILPFLLENKCKKCYLDF